MSQLDTLISQLGTTDTRKKIQLGNDAIALLNSSAKLECEDVGQFIDGLVPWLQSSNFKVVLNGLDIMYLLVQKMGEDFKHYISSVIPPTIDRLGDSKDAVREKAQLLLSTFMVSVVSPNLLLEKLIPAFSHKNGKVREEAMYCLQNTLNTHGAATITISRLMPHVIKLLSDPTATVRDCAFNTIIEAYKHYGERLRLDLQKKFSLPPAKLPALMTRCDEVRDTGLLLPGATTSVLASENGKY
ncbi:CLIP-associating protein [Armadillidium nasatum]|uniref:CLIP-associating protein n=1 Tax=Armadillidium nasatum TaxID=96803 RepID=A0A5N5SQL8_9CRUS|nr:CLIP-associating protein [Armadillidium nasatum]